MLGVLNQKQEIITPSTVEALIKQNLFIYDVYDYIEYFRYQIIDRVTFAENIPSEK